jgi:hypothetical protein
MKYTQGLSTKYYKAEEGTDTSLHLCKFAANLSI